MNKQLTKKTIAIAASAALIASVALSGSALAARKGPQASLDVMTVCNIDAVNEELIVDVTLTDPNKDTNKAQAVLESVTVQGLQKAGGGGKGSNTWTDGADSWSDAEKCEPVDKYTPAKDIEIGTTCTIKLDICGRYPNPDCDVEPTQGQEYCADASGNTIPAFLNILGDSKAVNARTTVMISGEIGNDVYGSSRNEYTSLCKDDPYTEDVNEANLKVADYPGLCD